jgi:hypothetical protein
MGKRQIKIEKQNQRMKIMEKFVNIVIKESKDKNNG